METQSPGKIQAGTASSQQAPEKQSRCVVLAGNPNVGKSAIFNALTGLSAEVSNYPGTTIDISRGRLGHDELVDTPGIYGVSSLNDEERIARNLILQANLVINVVSALSLERDLFLTLQLLDMGFPMIVVVNQADEADERGLTIDLQALQVELGVPVIRTVAVEKTGIFEIPAALQRAAVGQACPEILAAIQFLVASGVPRSVAVLALEGDQLEEWGSLEAVTRAAPQSVPRDDPSRESTADTSPLALSPVERRALFYRARRRRVNELVERIVTQKSLAGGFSQRLGRVLIHPVYGSVITLFVCYLLFYQLLGVWVAGDLVDLTEKRGMQTYYEPFVRRAAANVFPVAIDAGGEQFLFPQGTMHDPSTARSFDRVLSTTPPAQVSYDFWQYRTVFSAIGNALVGDYGVLTLTVTYLLGLLFPLVLAFYLGLSLLEDSGYLPRLAVLVDKILNRLGLNGRAIIPLILGLGCVTMATVTTRLLSSTREKIIATVLLGVAIPCSAQLGIVSGVLAMSGGLLPWLVYGTVIGGMLGLTGVLLNKLMPGKSEALLIDLPPMRLPRMGNVLQKTWTKSRNFLIESIPMFVLAGLVVSLGQVTGLLDFVIRLLKPLTVHLLALPDDPRVATTFILGVVRRDFAAFGLTEVALSPVQAVVSMIVITLFVPCIATVGVMIKERGAPIALAVWLGSWLAAFCVGGLLAHLLPPLFHLTGSC